MVKFKPFFMKKLFTLALVIGAFSLTSCKKDWTCECKDTSTGVVDFTFTQKSTKAKAKTWCEAFNSTYSSVGDKCELK